MVKLNEVLFVGTSRNGGFVFRYLFNFNASILRVGDVLCVRARVCARCSGLR